MKSTVKSVLLALVIILMPNAVKSQTTEQEDILLNLCQKWIIDSIEINDQQKKFPPPENIKNNYSEFRNDGTFQGQDFDVVLSGKWKIDYEKMQIINYDIDNPLITGEIVFTIVNISKEHLAITSGPMSGNQVTMHYKPSNE
jgi:hypothetical protein